MGEPRKKDSEEIDQSLFKQIKEGMKSDKQPEIFDQEQEPYDDPLPNLTDRITDDLKVLKSGSLQDDDIENDDNVSLDSLDKMQNTINDFNDQFIEQIKNDESE